MDEWVRCGASLWQDPRDVKANAGLRRWHGKNWLSHRASADSRQRIPTQPCKPAGPRLRPARRNRLQTLRNRRSPAAPVLRAWASAFSTNSHSSVPGFCPCQTRMAIHHGRHACAAVRRGVNGHRLSRLTRCSWPAGAHFVRKISHERTSSHPWILFIAGYSHGHFGLEIQ